LQCAEGGHLHGTNLQVLPHRLQTSQLLCGFGDISNDIVTLRVNGTQTAQSTADQGTGNYNPSGTYPLFIGARNDASFRFIAA
jgi:hypothetical protein